MSLGVGVKGLWQLRLQDAASTGVPFKEVMAEVYG